MHAYYPDIQRRIAEATTAHDFEEAARLAQIAAQLKRLDEQRNQLLASVRPAPVAATPSPVAAKSVPKPSSGDSARLASRGGLAVEIKSEDGRSLRICERTATDTVVALMERIMTLFGLSGLEKLMSLQVSRGPLISRDPRRDYLNASTGNLYAHHRIPGTSLYVLTHSDTQQKVKDLTAALQRLGLPDQAFRVSL
ncbi:MAG TPA: hypothetical protein VGM54_03940 [Chthoniobacter sp.]|jgi:hypothetical protein